VHASTFPPRRANCFIENSANQKSEQFCSRPLKARAITAPTNLHLFVPGEGTSCRPLLPKIIRAAATSASRRMTLTVQAAALLPPRDRTGLTMLTAMAAIFIVLSIGILIAHALDAFRSR
jgi:hypothetical protein